MFAVDPSIRKEKEKEKKIKMKGSAAFPLCSLRVGLCALCSMQCGWTAQVLFTLNFAEIFKGQSCVYKNEKRLEYF